jgi:hypothetical protein
MTWVSLGALVEIPKYFSDVLEARDPVFEKASIKYGWHSGIAMEVFRQIPKWSVP